MDRGPLKSVTGGRRAQVGAAKDGSQTPPRQLLAPGPRPFPGGGMGTGKDGGEGASKRVKKDRRAMTTDF